MSNLSTIYKCQTHISYPNPSHSRLHGYVGGLEKSEHSVYICNMLAPVVLFQIIICIVHARVEFFIQCCDTGGRFGKRQKHPTTERNEDDGSVFEQRKVGKLCICRRGQSRGPCLPTQVTIPSQGGWLRIFSSHKVSKRRHINLVKIKLGIGFKGVAALQAMAASRQCMYRRLHYQAYLPL